MVDLILEPAAELGGEVVVVQKVVDGQASAQRALSFPNVDLEAFDVIVFEQDTAGNWNPVASTVGVAEGGEGIASPGYTNAEIDAFLATKPSRQELTDLLASATGLPFTDTRTAAYTLALTDADKLVPVSSASAVTVTVPAHAEVPFPKGTTLYVAQDGIGAVTIAGAAGVMVHTADGYQVGGQWLDVSLHKRDLNTWVLKGAVS